MQFATDDMHAKSMQEATIEKLTTKTNNWFEHDNEFVTKLWTLLLPDFHAELIAFTFEIYIYLTDIRSLNRRSDERDLKEARSENWSGDSNERIIQFSRELDFESE